MNRNTKIFLGILFTLAAVGLFDVLNTNPFMFFFSIVLTVGIIYFVNRVMSNRRPSDNGYQKALRTQKKRNKLTPSELHKLTKLKRTSKSVPFRVIEGRKKGKHDKDRQTNTNIH